MENASTPLNDSHPTIQRCIAAYQRVRAELPEDPYHHVNLENQYKAYLAFCAELPLLVDPPSVLLYIACVGRGVGIGALDSSDAGRLGHLAQMAMSAWKLINLTIPAAEQKQQEFQQKQEDAKLRRQQAAEKRRQEAEDRAQRAEQKQQQAAQKGQASGPLPPPKGNQSHPAEPLQPSVSGENKAKPTPPNGNHPQPDPNHWENLYASTKLPDWETQQAHFQALRRRGVEIPSDEELQANPQQALHLVETARWYMRSELVSRPASAAPSAPPPASQPAPTQPATPTQAA